MRVLVAFDKFKDSLSAREACTFAAAVLRERHPDWSLDLCPLADGGEGFASILTEAAGGQTIGSSVSDPLGDDVQATIGIVQVERIPAAARVHLGLVAADDAVRAEGTEKRSSAAMRTATVAVIEMASASGLALLAEDERDPWETTTYGTGELIRTAAELGASGILLGVGGSATHDLGLGALAALGLQFRSTRGEPIDVPVPARWHEISRIDGRIFPPLPPIRIACDVTNPLLGDHGAAAIYGPQKGLRAGDLPRLEEESARLAQLLCAHCGKPESMMHTPGAGAAGGIAFGLMTATDAQLLPGFTLVSTWLDLEARLAAADVVITGEGRFDDSSLLGKGPGAVAARALALGKQVHVFAGQTAITQPPAGLSVHTITPPGTPLANALMKASQYLLASLSRTF